MEASDIKRLKEIQEKNEKLKRMYAEMALGNVPPADFKRLITVGNSINQLCA